jgi:hypothetical protein
MSRKKEKKISIQVSKDSRVQEVENLHIIIKSRGLPGHTLGSRGTRRKELFDTLPLLIKTRLF